VISPKANSYTQLPTEGEADSSPTLVLAAQVCSALPTLRTQLLKHQKHFCIVHTSGSVVQASLAGCSDRAKASTVSEHSNVGVPLDYHIFCAKTYIPIQEGLTAALQDLADGCPLPDGRACAVRLLEALPTRREAAAALHSALRSGAADLSALLQGCRPPRLLYYAQVRGSPSGAACHALHMHPETES
jgi:hypothetical protein